MTNKRKAASPIKAGTLGETASQYKNQIDATTEFALQPDYKMANRFFDILTDGKDDAITFQFFDDKDKKSKAFHCHMKRSAGYALPYKKQKEGCGVWVMVNAGDGKGRRGENVVSVRSFFIDLDGSPWEPAAKALNPHMRVESSPGRWHLYWLVDDCPLGQFKLIQQAIAAKFNGDKSCCDLPRVLRVPGFYHLKDQPVMTKLVEVNEFPSYTTQEIIDGLGLEMAAPGKVTRKQKAGPQLSSSVAYAYTNQTTGEIIDLAEWAAQHPAFDIVMAINPQYVLGSIVDGKQHIVCPFTHEHTDTSPDSATFIANADTEHPSFTIHCMHQHCADRDRLEFLQAMLEGGWLPESVLSQEPLELKKPKWIKFQVQEISSSPEWYHLLPEERRIALDLLYLAWTTDGTIDDEWQITRHLGLDADRWREYRYILKKVGWLIELDGRLTNFIVKREFDISQTEYSKSVADGRKGGKISQENRRMKTNQ